MQINKTDIDALNATLTLTVEPQDYTEVVEKQLKDIRRKANIPGFRKGMVPLGLVKKMYRNAVMAEEINKLLSEKLYGYIRDEKLNVLGDPMPNTEDQDPIDFDNNDTFDFKFDIAVAPEFDIKPTAKDKLTNYKIEVTDKMVDNQVEGYAQRFGKRVTVDEAQADDLIKGHITGEGVDVENGIISPNYMKDDEQKALFAGAKVGQSIVFNPKKAFGSEAEVASMLKISKEEAQTFDKDVTIEITEITRYVKAEINQELFDKVYGEGAVADEAAFRARVKAEIEGNMEQDAAYKFGIDAKEMILAKMKDLEFPRAFLKRWLLATNDKVTEEQIDNDFDLMIEDLKWQLAKNQIAEANNLDVKKEEVEDYAKQVARMQFLQYGISNVGDDILANYAQDMLKQEDQMRAMVTRVEENKIYEIIKQAATVKDQKISQEDFQKLFENK